MHISLPILKTTFIFWALLAIVACNNKYVFLTEHKDESGNNRRRPVRIPNPPFEPTDWQPFENESISKQAKNRDIYKFFHREVLKAGFKSSFYFDFDGGFAVVSNICEIDANGKIINNSGVHETNDWLQKLGQKFTLITSPAIDAYYECFFIFSSPNIKDPGDVGKGQILSRLNNTTDFSDLLLKHQMLNDSVLNSPLRPNTKFALFRYIFYKRANDGGNEAKLIKLPYDKSSDELTETTLFKNLRDDKN